MFIIEKSSFFNSVNQDRLYDASSFAEYFNSLITNGVFPNPSTNLQIISNNDMTVTASVGKAWINGYVYINDSTLIMPIEVADGVLKRIDRVVVQYSTINREIKVKVKKGTFASSPVAPILQRDADIYELGIADISIVNGATSITQANITDLRLNTTLCGYVNSLIQADTTAIFDQYQAWFTATSGTYNTEMTASEAQFQTDFDTWFDAMKDQLTTDAAGNLQTQINTLAGTGWTTETVKGNADAIVTTNTNVTDLSDSVDSQLAETPKKTVANLTYYVATTGNDTTGDGTSGLPFKTIQYAIDKLPQIINHVAIINVSTGTYAEDIEVSGFIGGGTLTIAGGTDLATAANYIVNSIKSIGDTLNIKFIGFTLSTSIVDSITITQCNPVHFEFCRAIAPTSTYHGIRAMDSMAYLYTCEISNKKYGIYAVMLSTVLSRMNSGTSNTVALYAYAGTIIKISSQPSGTTSETVINGGVIR